MNKVPRIALWTVLSTTSLVAILPPATACAQVVFTDAPLTAGLAPKAVHVTELRTTIAALRALRGLPLFAFTDPTLTAGVTRIRAVHITELRTALNEVFDDLAMARPAYSDDVLTGMQLKRAHIEEIRSAAIHVKWELQPKVQVTFAGTGAGTVSAASGLTCNLSCTANFPLGSTVTLTVAPVTGSQFNGWSGACSGTGACQLSLNGDKGVTATFTKSVTTPPPLIVTGIDRTTARPFDLVTLSGTGFDPANSAISVYVSPAASVLPIAVPVVWATSTSVTFAAPPLLEMYVGAFTSGPVKLQVIAAVGSKLSTSDFFTGLTIAAPRSVTVSSGKMTRAFLQSAFAVADTTRQALGPGELGARLLQLQTDLTTVINGVSSIISNPAATVTLPTANGSFVLDKQVVDILDTLALAYAEGFNTPAPNAGATTAIAAGRAVGPFANSPPCLYTDLDPVSAEFLCGGEQARRNYAQASLDAWVWGAKLELGLSAALIGGWAAVVATPGAPAVPGTPWLEKAGKALQLLWAATPAHLTSAFRAPGQAPIAEPPPETSASVIDSLATDGAAVLVSTRTAADILLKVSALRASAAAAVQRGLIQLRSSAVQGERRVGATLCLSVRGAPRGAISSSSCAPLETYTLVPPLSRETIALDGSTPVKCDECYRRYDRAALLCDPLFNAGQSLAALKCVNAALDEYKLCLTKCSGQPQPTGDPAREAEPAIRPVHDRRRTTIDPAVLWQNPGHEQPL